MRPKPRADIKEKCIKSTPIGCDVNDVDFQYKDAIVLPMRISCHTVGYIARQPYTSCPPACPDPEGYIRHGGRCPLIAPQSRLRHTLDYVRVTFSIQAEDEARSHGRCAMVLVNLEACDKCMGLGLVDSQADIRCHMTFQPMCGDVELTWIHRAPILDTKVIQSQDECYSVTYSV